MNITPQVSWLTESFTNWCAHLCGLGGDHKLLSMSLTFTLFWCCFSIHIVTHCGCERGGHCAVKYMVKTFCKRATKGLLICFTICFLLSVGQPDIFTRWTMSNLMDAIQTLPLWRWAEINLTRTFSDEIWWVKYGPGPGFLWLTARLVMPNLEPPYAPLAVQLCTSASGLYIRFDNK